MGHAMRLLTSLTFCDSVRLTSLNLETRAIWGLQASERIARLYKSFQLPFERLREETPALPSGADPCNTGVSQ
jgi:hypothetical protein